MADCTCGKGKGHQDCNCDFLQDLIDSGEGMVEIPTGVYYGTVSIDKTNIDFVADEDGTVTLVGDGSHTAVTINAENVSVSGLIIVNYEKGIHVLGNNASISDCVFYGCPTSIQAGDKEKTISNLSVVNVEDSGVIPTGFDNL